jgi:dethiobiotin synthetase
MKQLFITATDTDAGKTYFARVLIQAIKNQDKKVAAYKPIAAGCEKTAQGLVNEDAEHLFNVANCQQTIAQINPIAFEEAIAPHIAAQKHQQVISIEEISKGLVQCQQLQPDFIITEGAGGWRLPLGNGKYLSDFVKASQQQVILVVNMKLGCLNHAVLTYESIIADGLQCVAWVANCQEAMPYLAENINELEKLLPIVKLGNLAFNHDISEAAQGLDISSLLL